MLASQICSTLQKVRFVVSAACACFIGIRSPYTMSRLVLMNKGVQVISAMRSLPGCT